MNHELNCKCQNRSFLEENINSINSVFLESICKPLHTNWSHNIDKEVHKYLHSSNTENTLTPEELKNLLSFLASPLKKILTDNVIYNKNISDAELKTNVVKTYNKILEGSEKLKERIQKLKDKDQYQLYDFKNSFNEFKSKLTEKNQEVVNHCYKKSSFAKVCTQNILVTGARCSSKVWKIAKEFLPILPITDAVAGLSHLSEAEHLGLISGKDSLEKRSELVVNAILGIGAGTTALSKGVLKLSKKTIISTSKSKSVSSDALIKSKEIKELSSNEQLEKILQSSIDSKHESNYIKVINENLRSNPSRKYPGIKSYTGIAHSRINFLLRAAKECNDECKKVIAELETLKSFKGNVFRFVNDLDEESLSNLCKGCTYKNKAFWSSTVDGKQPASLKSTEDISSSTGSSSYSRDAKHIFVIKSETGKPISSLSAIPAEEEILFKPNSSFKVNEIKEVKVGDKIEKIIYYLDETVE